MDQVDLELRLKTEKAEAAMLAAAKKGRDLFENKGFNLNLKSGNLPLGRITGDFDKFSGSLDAATARVLAFTATTTVVYGLATAFNRLFTDSIKLEKQLAGIQAILQTSNSNLQKFSSELFKVANATGQSFDVAAAAASEFARQGLSVEETLKATNAALAFSKIAGTDAAQTVENLTAALNTFAGEALTYTDVLDTIVSLDNAFAISAAGISDGLKRVGSVASASGIQLKEIASLIAVVQQVSARGAPVISNGLKTIFTRLSRTNVQETLNSIGVTTQDSNGEFRSQIDVLTDLANKLDTLSDKQRAFVLEQVAGVYQINTLQATLKSLTGEYSLFDKAVKVASDSSGNAAERLKILTDTTDANLQKLKNNITQFLAETGKATVKPVLDSFIGIGNKILETLNLGAAAEGGEKAGVSIGKVLLNGISSALAGPGSVLLVVTITRLLAKITKDAFTAVQTLAGLKKVSLVDEKVQMAVNRAIEMGNKGLVDRLRTATSLVDKARILQTLMADMDRKLAMAQVKQAVQTGLAANRKAGGRGGNKAAGYIPNFSKGFIPNFSKGAIPKPLEELEKKTARLKAYAPGKVIPAPNGGVMSTAETATEIEFKGKKDFVISPPQYSIAGRDHAKDFEKQYGANIYDFIGKKSVTAKGFIPNFLDPEYIEQRKAERIPKAQRTPEQQAVRDANAAEVKRGRKELINIGDFAGGKVYNEKAEEQFRIAIKNRNVEWDDKITNVGFEVIEIDVGEDRPQKTLPDGSKKNASTNFKNSIVKKPKGDITNLTNKFEAFAIRQLNKRKDRDFNFQKARLTAFGAGNSAVDGYSINPAKNSIDLLEVKSGDWKTPSDISNKIGRFVPENIATLGKPIESLFKESNRAPYSFDTIKLRNILAVPKITKQKFAGSPKKELINKKWTSILNYKGEKPSVIAKNLNLLPITKQDVQRQFSGNANASTPSFTIQNGRLVRTEPAKKPTAKQGYQNTLKAIAEQAKGMKLRAEGFIPNFASNPFVSGITSSSSLRAVPGAQAVPPPQSSRIIPPPKINLNKTNPRGKKEIAADLFKGLLKAGAMVYARDGMLGDATNAFTDGETDNMVALIKGNAQWAKAWMGAIGVNRFVADAAKNGLRVAGSLQKALTGRNRTSAEGFIPNFSSPFSPPEPSYAELMRAQKESVNAEMSSGFERKDVKIGISNDAKTPLNPQGLAVYNKEEGTLSKGVSYAKMAKIDPATKRTYGDDLGEGTAISAFGFIPNFATPKEKRAQKRAEIAQKRAERDKRRKEKAANLKPTRVLPPTPSNRTSSIWGRGSNNLYSSPNTPTNYFSSPPGSSVQTSTGSPQPAPSKPAISIPPQSQPLRIQENRQPRQPKQIGPTNISTGSTIPMRAPETRISVPENRLGSPRYSPVSGSQRGNGIPNPASTYQRGNTTPNYPRLSGGVDINNLKSATGTVIGSKLPKSARAAGPTIIPSGPTIPMSGPLQKKPKQPKQQRPKKMDPARGMGLATAAAFAIPTLTGMLSTPAEGEEQTKGQKIAQGAGEAIGAGIAAASVALMIPAFAPLAPAIGLVVAGFKGLKSVSEASIPSLSNLKKENDKLVQSAESQTNSLTEAVKAQDELSQLKESGGDPRKIANAQLKFAKSLSGIKDTNLVSTLTNEKDDVKKQEAIVTYQEKINQDLKFSQGNLATQTIIQQSQKENSSIFDPIVGRKTKTKAFKAEDFSLYLDPIIESLDFTKDATGKAAEGLKEVANGTRNWEQFLKEFGTTLGMSEAQVKMARDTYNGLNGEFTEESLKALDKTAAATAIYNKNLKESIVTEKPNFNIDIQGVFDKALKSLTLDTALINYKNFASAGTNLDIEKNRLNLESESGRLTETAATNRSADLKIKELKLETDKKGTELISNAVDDLIKIIPKETSTEQKSNILNQANAVLRGGGDISSLENAIKQTLDSSDKSKEVLTQIANISQQTVEGIERLRIDQSEGTRSINVIAQDQLREAEKRNKEEIGRSALAGPPQYANKLMDTGAVLETDAKIQKLRSKAERSGGARTEQGRKLLLEASNLEMQNDRIKSKDELAQAERYGKDNVVKRTDAERSGMAQIQKNMADDIGQKLKDLNTTRGKSGKSSIFSSQDIKKITEGIQIGGEGAAESRRMLEEKLNNPNYAQDSTVQSFAREIKSVGGSNSIFANNSQMPAVSGANVPIAASAGVAGVGFPTVPSAAGVGAPTVPSVATGGSGVPMIPSAAGAGTPTVPSVATGGSGAQMALGSAQLPTGQSFTSGSMPRNQAFETIQKIVDIEKNNKDYADFEAEKERNKKLKQQRDVLSATPLSVLQNNTKSAQSLALPNIAPEVSGNMGGMGGMAPRATIFEKQQSDFLKRMQSGEQLTETDFEDLKASVNVDKATGKARDKLDSSQRQSFIEQVQKSGYVFKEDLGSVESKIASTEASRRKKLNAGQTTEQEDKDLKALEERQALLKLKPEQLEEQIKRSDQDLIKRQEALKPVIAGVESMANGTGYSKGLGERLMGGAKRPSIKEKNQTDNFDVGTSLDLVGKAKEEKNALEKEIESNASNIKRMEASRSSASTPEQDKALVDARNKQKELIAKRDAVNADIKQGESAIGQAPKATQGFLQQKKNAIIPDSSLEDKKISDYSSQLGIKPLEERLANGKVAKKGSTEKLDNTIAELEGDLQSNQITIRGFDNEVAQKALSRANERGKLSVTKYKTPEQIARYDELQKTAKEDDDELIKLGRYNRGTNLFAKDLEEKQNIEKIAEKDRTDSQRERLKKINSDEDFRAYEDTTKKVTVRRATDKEKSEQEGKLKAAYLERGSIIDRNVKIDSAPPDKPVMEPLTVEEKIKTQQEIEQLKSKNPQTAARLDAAKKAKEGKRGQVQSTEEYDKNISRLTDELANGRTKQGKDGKFAKTALTEEEKKQTQADIARIQAQKKTAEESNAEIVRLDQGIYQADQAYLAQSPADYYRSAKKEEEGLGKVQSTDVYDKRASTLQDELTKGRVTVGPKGEMTRTALTEEEKVRTQASLKKTQEDKANAEAQNAKIAQSKSKQDKAKQRLKITDPQEYLRILQEEDAVKSKETASVMSAGKASYQKLTTLKTEREKIKGELDSGFRDGVNEKGEKTKIALTKDQRASQQEALKLKDQQIYDEEKKKEGLAAQLPKAKDEEARKKELESAQGRANRLDPVKMQNEAIAKLKASKDPNLQSVGAQMESISQKELELKTLNDSALTPEEQKRFSEMEATKDSDAKATEFNKLSDIPFKDRTPEQQARMDVLNKEQGYTKGNYELLSKANKRDSNEKKFDERAAIEAIPEADRTQEQKDNLSRLNQGESKAVLDQVGKDRAIRTKAAAAPQLKEKTDALKTQIDAEKQALGASYDKNRGAIDQTLYKDQVAPMLVEQIANPEDRVKVAEFNDKVQERQAKEAELDPVNKKIADIEAKRKERSAVVSEANKALTGNGAENDKKRAIFSKFASGELTAEEANKQSGGQLGAAFDRVSKNRMNKQAADQAKADLATSGDSVEERTRKKEIYGKFSRGEITQEEADKQTGGGLKAAFAKVVPDQNAPKFADLNNVGNIKEEEKRKAEIEKQVAKAKEEENTLGAAIKPLLDAVTALTAAQTATKEGEAAGTTQGGTAPAPGAEEGQKTIASTSTVNVSVTGGSLSDPQIVELKNGLIAEMKTIVGQAILSSTGKPAIFGPPETTAVA